jgi:hypothetical protein
MSTDRRQRFKAQAMTAVIVLLLLILINLTVYAVARANREEILAQAPELEELLRAHGRAEMFLIGLISLTYLAGMTLVTILGADRGGEEAEAALELSTEERREREIETLTGLAEELDRIAELPNSRQLSARLRELVDLKQNISRRAD